MRSRNIDLHAEIDVFISYRTKDPDLSLARTFKSKLNDAGYKTFLAADDIHWGDGWPDRIQKALGSAQVFLLLLSPESSRSEMVIEEVRRARTLLDKSGNRKPLLLPLRVNLGINEQLNYDLDGYLGRIQQRSWTSPSDTDPLLSELVAVLSSRHASTWGADGKAAEASMTAASDEDSPRPVGKPEIPQGQVDLQSKFYIRRPPIEEICFDAIETDGSLIRIKAPRQMGKTSLLARVLAHSRSLGHTPISLSFQLADTDAFHDFESFVYWFCSTLAWKLHSDNTIERYASLRGAKVRCTAFLADLLNSSSKPLMLGLDETDLVFEKLDIAKNFFGLLRAWHEEGKVPGVWKNLRMVIVHSTEVYVPLDINQSPFNVGLPISLPEFDFAQVLDAAARHGVDWDTADAGILMDAVGGHPYLVRVALYKIAQSGETLPELIAGAPTDGGLFGDHLRRHLWNLHTYPESEVSVRTTPLTCGCHASVAINIFMSEPNEIRQ